MRSGHMHLSSEVVIFERSQPKAIAMIFRQSAMTDASGGGSTERE